jgi:hypothetical protein
VLDGYYATEYIQRVKEDNMNNAATPAVATNAAAGWISEAGYRFGKGSSVNSSTRREARKVSWMKRQIRRSARRNDRAELRARLDELAAA